MTKVAGLADPRQCPPMADLSMPRPLSCHGAPIADRPLPQAFLAALKEGWALTEAPALSLDWGGGSGAERDRAGLPRDAHRARIRAKNRCRASPLGEVTRGGRSSCPRAGVASWAMRHCERYSKIGASPRSSCEQAVFASTPPAHDPRDPLDIVIQ